MRYYMTARCNCLASSGNPRSFGAFWRGALNRCLLRSNSSSSAPSGSVPFYGRSRSYRCAISTARKHFASPSLRMNPPPRRSIQRFAFAIPSERSAFEENPMQEAFYCVYLIERISHWPVTRSGWARLSPQYTRHTGICGAIAHAPADS